MELVEGGELFDPLISPHLPTSPHVSPHLPTSPHISPHLTISPHISPRLPTSPPSPRRRYDERLPALATLVASTVRSFEPTLPAFERKVDILRRQLRDAERRQPISLAGYRRGLALQPARFSNEQLAAAAGEVSLSDVAAMQEGSRSGMRIHAPFRRIWPYSALCTVFASLLFTRCSEYAARGRPPALRSACSPRGLPISPHISPYLPP